MESVPSTAQQTSTIYIKEKELLYTKLRAILPEFEPDILKLVDVIMLTIDQKQRTEFIKKVGISFKPQLLKLILSQNQFRNADARPIGIEISNFFNSKGAQNILNVKHLKAEAKLTRADPMVC
jgi:hypothetical protein